MHCPKIISNNVRVHFTQRMFIIVFQWCVSRTQCNYVCQSYTMCQSYIMQIRNRASK